MMSGNTISEISKPKGKQYYFDPFNKHLDIKESSIDKFSAKENCTIIRSLEELKNIENSSTLLIDGHSAAGLNQLANAFEKATETYSGMQLAVRLNAHLNKDHVKIKLLACHGGTALAPELAKWLGTFGFKKIAVGGYMHSFFQVEKGRAWISLPSGEDVENFTDSGFVQWYNSKGELSNKPRFD